MLLLVVPMTGNFYIAADEKVFNEVELGLGKHNQSMVYKFMSENFEKQK
jgi:hypothetical protein